MDHYVKANRDLWNARTPHHLEAAFYDVAAFKAGRRPLDPLVLAGLGDVAGRSVLHLQCHFGLDSIALARLGARVTGIDFSDVAIRAGRSLAAEVGADVTFVESTVADLPSHLDARFDVVFTSYGVLGWLPDLARWGAVIAHFLHPGGRLFVVDAHPVAYVFDERRADGELRIRYPYFSGPEPIHEEMHGSYAAPGAPIHGVEHVWLHTLADVIGALIGAGLRIDAFEEHPFIAWRHFPWLEHRDGFWRFPDGRNDIPLMFSIAASKPA